MTKEVLEEKIKMLIESAKARGTEQGVQVYEIILSKISAAKTPAELEAIWKHLNQVLSKINAHGHFTDSEFAVVQELWRTLPYSRDRR